MKSCYDFAIIHLNSNLAKWIMPNGGYKFTTRLESKQNIFKTTFPIPQNILYHSWFLSQGIRMQIQHTNQTIEPLKKHISRVKSATTQQRLPFFGFLGFSEFEVEFPQTHTHTCRVPQQKITSFLFQSFFWVWGRIFITEHTNIDKQISENQHKGGIGEQGKSNNLRQRKGIIRNKAKPII